jgi:hypothetical protein
MPGSPAPRAPAQTTDQQPGRPPSTLRLTDRIGVAARTAAAKVAGRLAAFASTPIVPGIGRMRSGVSLTPDPEAQRRVDSREALYGRVTAQLGPVPSNISTNPNRGLTPERITTIQQQVLTAGWMLDWACLVEDVMLTDSQVRSVHESGSEAVAGSPFTVEPFDGSELARQVADYQQTVLDNMSGWDRAMERLLLGNAGGYALEDVCYEDREVTFPVGEGHATVAAPTPVGLDFVHNKHTRWNLAKGDELELDCGGGFIRPPPHKFIRYEASGGYQVRRRGWMYPAIWLHLLKANAWARWGVVLDIWGIPVPYGIADPQLWQDEKRRAEMLKALRDYGLGLSALFTNDFEIKSSPASSSPLDARGMHAAIIAAINLELSKLILGSTLTTEISGTGSYNASETHADTKQARVIKWERNLSSCVRDWMRAALRLACFRIVADGSEDGINPRGLCAALGATPAQILAVCGRPTWRIQREVTPEVRMQLFADGVNELGLDIDEDQPYREFGFARARNPSRRLRGRPVVLAGDGAATSTTEALEGASNPRPDEVAQAA